ncbi:MAG: InlB B-repeat-containing protein, partial [Lachnospiraceae bacterium]|nr:InlB B-repeat-containing protein [Lachnospiraceae bacterium]
GYKLKGWNTQADGNGTMYADKGEILNLTPDDGAEIKLYAIWEKATYKITYAGLADEEVASFGLPTEYKIDSPVITFADYTASIARTGYKFKGLYKDSKYKSSYKTIATGSTGDKKVYVKMAANKYKIKFVRNEASVSGSPKASGSMKTQTVTYGKTVRLTSNAFKLKGHTFKGWNTEADGSGIPYTNKASISNLTAVDGETITLYAQWE